MHTESGSKLTKSNRAFYIVAIAIFANFLTIFFFMPETTYYGTRPSMTMLEAVDRLGNSEKTAGTGVGETSSSDPETPSEIGSKNIFSP